MKKKEAKEWFDSLAKMGTNPEREEWIENYGGSLVKKYLRNDPNFLLGVEYGILIALNKVFNFLPIPKSK